MTAGDCRSGPRRLCIGYYIYDSIDGATRREGVTMASALDRSAVKRQIVPSRGGGRIGALEAPSGLARWIRVGLPQSTAQTWSKRQVSLAAYERA